MELNSRDPQHVAEFIMAFMNGASDAQINELVLHLAGDHRTLQQKFSGFVVKWIRINADPTRVHDLRNEASVKLWYELRHTLEDLLPSGLKGFVRFPMI